MKDIVSLRNHLFDQLNRLAETQDPDNLKIEIDRASSIVQVSETIIKTAEVENTFIAITKSFGSGFVPVVNNGKPVSLIEKLQQATKPVGNEEVFNVDDKKNWLIDESTKGGEE